MEWVTNTAILNGLRATQSREAWDVFVEHFRPMLVNYARNFDLPSNCREDAAQETLTQFVEQLRAGKYERQRGRLHDWLFGIAHNVILAYARSLPRERPMSDVAGEGSPFEQLANEDAAKHTWDTEWRNMVLVGCLKRASRDFTGKTFEAFWLCAHDGKAAGDVARELGMTVQAVYMAKHHVLAKMREYVSKCDDAFYGYEKMPCLDDSLIEKYVRGQLDCGQVTELRKHIESCEACRSRVQTVQMNESLLSELRSMWDASGVDVRTNLASLKEGPTDGYFLSSVPSGLLRLKISRDTVLGDRYQIIRELGHGIAPVYQAHDRRLKSDVALKIVAIAPGGTEEKGEQLRQELLLRTPISDFNHIIKAFDIHPIDFEGLSLVLLAMEYAEGGSLRSWLNERGNDRTGRIADGLRFLQQACLGCKAAHEHKVIHLDIKPENILLCRVEGHLVAKLSDFGISRSLRQLSVGASVESLLVAGTPRYMSPEQFCATTDGKIDTESDIYSLGIVLFEILEGIPPFSGTFSELRDQHLNASPPPLTTDVRRWSRVVDRCLAKRPEDRYSSVEQLAADLLRGQKGYSLSVDAACPGCGHINQDQRLTDCNRCGAVLPKSHFRPCPRCLGFVRLDQDDCPLCGRRGVAAYYLLEERKEVIERLKDEVPAEAIELLETVLREGAADFEHRAVELTKELRGKQERIKPLATGAQEAVSAGRVEEAIRIWDGVLEIVPRHRTALAERNRLKAMLQEFEAQQTKAMALMEEARFDVADTLLQRCLELKPTSDDTRRLLETCRHRAHAYSKAFEEASAAFASKLLSKSQLAVREALVQATRSPEALALSQKLLATEHENGKLIVQVRKHIPRAEFAAAEKLIQRVEELQADNKEILALRAEMDRANISYSESMESARKAGDARHLQEVVQATAKALGYCPESPEARSLSEQAKTKQRNALNLVEQAKSACRKADFEVAQALLRQASQLWANLQGLNDCENQLTRVRGSYDQSIMRARRAKEEKQLLQVIEVAKAALGQCPESAEASELMRDAENQRSQVQDSLAKWRQFLKAADFLEARAQLERAATLWPPCEEVRAAVDEMNSVTSNFRSNMADAESKLAENFFEAATAACDAASMLCPNAHDVQSLRDRIERARELYYLQLAEKRRTVCERREKAVTVVILAGRVLTIGAVLALLVLGILFSLRRWTDFRSFCNSHRVGCALALYLVLNLGPVVHIVRRTNFFRHCLALADDSRFLAAVFAYGIILLVVVGVSGVLAAVLDDALSWNVDDVFAVFVLVWSSLSLIAAAHAFIARSEDS